jgi:hypothetical protein
MRIYAKTTALCTRAHFAIMTVCFVTAFTLGMNRFDAGDVGEGKA